MILAIAISFTTGIVATLALQHFFRSDKFKEIEEKAKDAVKSKL